MLAPQRWSTIETTGPSPCKRRSHGMIAVGLKLFVYGGEGAETTSDLWCFDFGKGWCLYGSSSCTKILILGSKLAKLRCIYSYHGKSWKCLQTSKSIPCPYTLVIYAPYRTDPDFICESTFFELHLIRRADSYLM